MKDDKAVTLVIIFLILMVETYLEAVNMISKIHFVLYGRTQ